jgi:sugar lactone lactonase YvrE
MTPQIFITGLCFGEGPRWHHGRLYLSDMHDHRVLAITPDGQRETIVEVAHQPSGLGWTPTGDLLIVSMTDRRLLRFDGASLTQVADLSGLAEFHCNDMVVDAGGGAYIGNFGFDLHRAAPFRPAALIRVEPDGRARVVANNLAFPNGTVITPDGGTLIVAESYGGRLTAFDIVARGELANRREWARLPQGAVPDGICLDAGGGIWVASPRSNECLRIEAGGNVTHRIALARGAFACMLGGEERRTLYMLTASSSDPDSCRANRDGRIEVATAPYPGVGLP